MDKADTPHPLQVLFHQAAPRGQVPTAYENRPSATNSTNESDRELLAAFAKSAGVLIAECGPEWGGKIAYATREHPNSRVCGFRTEAAAHKHWLQDTFGADTAKAVMSLMRRAASGKARP